MKYALATLLLLSGTALADRFVIPERGDSVNEDNGDLVALRPHNDMIVPLVPPVVDATVTSNTIFMNRCASGCNVKRGNSDSSLTDTSAIVSKPGLVSQFPYGDTAWSQVMDCVTKTFAPFNVVITDQDPGSAHHLEIMVGGTPQNLGFDSTTGGIAPFYCLAYQSDALVFDFAGIWGSGSTCDAQCVTNVCATAAQEIAHTWGLDHVTDPSDPMTYYGQTVVTQRRYKDAELQCGSDCFNGQTALGDTCSGANKQSHACSCTGAQTQNDYQTIKGLFGGTAPTPPTITIMDPKDGATVVAGFPVHADVQDGDGVAKVDLKVDGTMVSSVTTAPYAFNAPATLANGTHHVEVIGTDVYGATASAAIDVIIGKGCDDSDPCPNSGDVCVGGKCVAGSGTPGGLGTACTDGSMCTSGICANGNNGQVCVTTCSTGQCPSGFGCAVPTGMANGVCYPGVDDGSGGGGCSAGNGSLGMGLALGALLVSRRRRRALGA